MTRGKTKATIKSALSKRIKWTERSNRKKKQSANQPHVNFQNVPLKNNRFYLSTYFRVCISVWECRLRFPSSMILIIVRALFYTNLNIVVHFCSRLFLLVVLLSLLHFFVFELETQIWIVGILTQSKKIVSYFLWFWHT